MFSGPCFSWFILAHLFFAHFFPSVGPSFLRLFYMLALSYQKYQLARKATLIKGIANVRRKVKIAVCFGTFNLQIYVGRHKFVS